MALVKTFPGGAKQAPMPGPNSAAYKKILADRKASRNRSKGKKTDKAARKHPKNGASFGSLKSRQAVVERAKREIWASMLKINESIIGLAKAGNFNAAKALFDFAGVYSLPEPEGEPAEAATATESAAAADAVAQPQQEDPVDAFFRSIGIARDAEPEMAGAGK
jgi:hypothetical protein